MEIIVPVLAGILLGLAFAWRFRNSLESACVSGTVCGIDGGQCTCGPDCKCSSSEAGSMKDCACGSSCRCVMKTQAGRNSIKALLDKGINSLEELKQALQYAVELEFSTIPPYLCAEWSIKDRKHPAAAIIHEVLVQEMVHMALACNMLSAIGGRPSLARPDFLPKYPTQGLPGGVHPDLKVELGALDLRSIQTFMAIEYPQQGPIALAGTFPSIGEFYGAIADAFEKLNPDIDLESKQFEHRFRVGEVFAVRSVADALRAIKLICEQGEGKSQDPLPPAEFGSGEPAHYYAFKQLLVGRRLRQSADGRWEFSGEPLSLPEVYRFAPDRTASTPEFRLALQELLLLLEKVWSHGPENFHASMQAMMRLRSEGLSLVRAGSCPDFSWTS